MSTLRIKGNIWIENNKGQVMGPGKKELLEAIQNTGSIKSASKAMKMSYRHAWEMTNNMNLIYAKPLIEKIAGGSNGGGTRLTKEGEELIAIYEKLFGEFETFKAEINKTI
jgi:molybdate transport system regulatory protein